VRIGREKLEEKTKRLDKRRVNNIQHDKHGLHIGGVELTQKVIKREPLLAVSSVNAVEILASNRGNSSVKSDRETTKQLTESSIAHNQRDLHPIWGDIYSRLHIAWKRWRA